MTLSKNSMLCPYSFCGSVCRVVLFFFSSRRRHTRCLSDWSSDVCSSDLTGKTGTPSAVTAGAGFTVTVNAVDANWNLISTNDTVSIASSDANAALPANAALAGGTQTFTVTLKTDRKSVV